MTISDSQRNAIENILNSKESIKESTQSIKDAVKSLAEEMGVKPAFVNRLVSIVEKERAKGGYIKEEREVFDIASRI